MDETQTNGLVTSPFMGSVTYQAWRLVKELESINSEEYPLQARQIRNAFLCFAAYILEQLRGFGEIQNDEDFKRMCALGGAVHELHSYIRYLHASLPRQSPPGLQVALNQLKNVHFPEERGEAVCLVRPQWKYNLTCIYANLLLENLVHHTVLDPQGTLEITQAKEILPALWRWWFGRLADQEKQQLNAEETPPAHIGVLSFAGLDTDDTLLYPLLAHELGHFIDFSYDPPLSLQISQSVGSIITMASVAEALQGALGTEVSEQEVERRYRELLRRTSICIRELLADLLAARMLGISFFIAQAEFFKSFTGWSESAMITPSGYPSSKFRLSVVLDHLLSDSFPGNLQSFLAEHSKSKWVDEVSWLQDFVNTWKQRLNDQQEAASTSTHGGGINPAQSKLDEIAESSVQSVMGQLSERASDVIPNDKRAYLSPRYFERISQLGRDVPPSCPSETTNSFAEIMSSSWVYQIRYGREQEIGEKNILDKYNEYAKTCRLVLKATELIPTQLAQAGFGRATIQQAEGDFGDGEKTGVLSTLDIRRRMVLPPDHPKHLTVMPLDLEKVQGASLDVHLGNWFVTARRTRLESVHLGDTAQERLLLSLGREDEFVQTGSSFLIHPGDFILGCTLEFVALPDDLMAFVEGRSGFGRMGLIIATASQVAPGFHGVVVLELSNSGTVPLKVKPGIPVAQLVFQTTTEPVPAKERYKGRYYCQVKP